jgi:hypothetical protein
MDNLSTQTGITRFLEINRQYGWLYNKTETLTNNDLKNKFTHLLIEAEFALDVRLEMFKETHRIIDFIRSYNGIYFSHSFKIPFPRIRWSPKIYILKKKYRYNL